MLYWGDKEYFKCKKSNLSNMILKYNTGENLCLGDKVLVDLAGFKFPGTVVYSEVLGSEKEEYNWCVRKKIKGVIVKWEDSDKPKAILFVGVTPESISDYITIEDTEDEDLIFLERSK